MKAAFLTQPGEIQIRDIDMPEPLPGEVRVRLRKTGICGSDVHFFGGDRLLNGPTIIGHEGLGEIDKTGDGVTDRKIGERVVIEPNIPCQKCIYCLQGRGNICPDKRVIGVNEAGCFAEYICLPEAFCWTVPKNVSDEDAVTIEPMAVAYHALFSSRTQPGDVIAIVGLGAIGLLICHLARVLGYQVFVSDLQESKLKQAMQMDAMVTPAFDAPSELKTYWEQQQVSAVFECAGSEKTASLVTAAAPRGSEIVLVGLSEKMATYQPLKMAREEVTLIGSIIYDHPLDFRRVIQLIRDNVIHPGQIISGTAPLADIQLALQLASDGQQSKIIVSINQ